MENRYGRSRGYALVVRGNLVHAGLERVCLARNHIVRDLDGLAVPLDNEQILGVQRSAREHADILGGYGNARFDCNVERHRHRGGVKPVCVHVHDDRLRARVGKIDIVGLDLGIARNRAYPLSVVRKVHELAVHDNADIAKRIVRGSVVL